ncbi:MAG: TSUP family transporter [Phototrophicaceae bacterium]|jgi:uncharacterized membrane protein YfcA
MVVVWVLGIIAFGFFAQTVTGFALGLIVMPVLIHNMGLESSRVLMALVATTGQLVLVIQLRKSLSPKAVGSLTLFSLLGIPLGNWIAESGVVTERGLLLTLGLIVTGYALYALLAPRLPHLQNDRWSGPVGLISGIFTGAYNVGGPPVIVYADARRWPPDTLRSNLQGFFMFKGFVLIGVHAASGNFTAPIWGWYLLALPAIAVGLILGNLLAGKIPVARFRQVVLVTLLVLGVQMIVG